MNEWMMSLARVAMAVVAVDEVGGGGGGASGELTIKSTPRSWSRGHRVKTEI